MSRRSIVTAPGFEQSYVPISWVLKKYPELLAGPVGAIIEQAIAGVSGVTKVSELPDDGEPGRLYYNETDGNYYVLAGSNWIDTRINNEPEQVIYSQPGTNPSGIAGESDTVISIWPYYIYRNAYNILMPVPDDAETGTVGIRLVPSTADNYLVNYVGCFTVPSPNTFFQVQLPSTVGIPDDDDFHEGSGFEPGHTYEFNILHDTCILKDITCTSLGEQREREVTEHVSDQPGPVVLQPII